MDIEVEYSREQLMMIAERALHTAGATVNLARNDLNLCALVDAQVHVGELALKILHEKETSD